ncbi:putative nuclease harbi1 [Mactra antiquata]
MVSNKCLHKTGDCLPFSPEKCAMLITACCRLHNICIDCGIDFEPIVQEEENDKQGHSEPLNAKNHRDRLADQLMK